MTLDQFYNPNNRVWNYYLNVVRMYSYSLFANAIVFATALPQVTITKMTATPDEVEVDAGEDVKVTITTEPFPANYPTITASSSAEGVATASVSGKVVTIHGVASGDHADGEATITLTAGNVTETISVTVPYEA